MDEELVQEYINRFNKYFSLLKNDENYSVWKIEIDNDFLKSNQQELADMLLKKSNDEKECFYTGALNLYGYRMGAARLKSINECFTIQDGYQDNAVIQYNLDEILNEETDSENPKKCTSHIVKWIVNPGSNTDIADAVLKKMFYPMVSNLSKTAPPRKHHECTVVIPPVSKEIQIPDWMSIFSKLQASDLTINIVNYGYLIDVKENERKYIFQHQTDEDNEFIVLSAYEIIRGHNTCLGCLAFDVTEHDCQYELQDIKSVSLNVDNIKGRYEKEKFAEVVSDWDYVDCQFDVSHGFNSFLGTSDASFGKAIYKLSDDNCISSEISESIVKVFKENEALQVTEICSRLLKQDNMYNVSLGDLAYVANTLQRDKRFVPVSIGTNKNYKLGTFKRLDKNIDVSELHRIPASFASFTWKVKDKNRKVIPYFKTDTSQHSQKQIIESIVSYYDHCTTAMVADELLYAYKDGEDPSAFLTAKVFMYLSQMDSLVIESRNEIITSFENVDNVEFKEIDKSNIKFVKETTERKTVKKSVERKSLIFKDSKNDISVLNTKVEEMDFSVRTYNCLKRAGLNTAGDIIKKDITDVSRIRNLGRNGQIEVVAKLRKLGLKLKD